MTHEMRQCINDDGVISLYYQLGEHPEDDPFHHDEILTPHWREFADALGNYSMPPDCVSKNENTAAFEIINIEMSDKVLEFLQEATMTNDTFSFKRV